MQFKITCLDCQKVLNASDELVGKKAKCPQCGMVIVVTAPEIVRGEDELEFIDDTSLDDNAADSTPEELRGKTAVAEPSGETKTCPMCGETIKAVALVCRFCKEDLGASVARRGQGIWRDGGQLVMCKDSELPARCVKTNEPTERTLVGVAGGLIGLIVGIVKSRVVAPTKITETHVWLKGVHPDYLASLPTWSES